MFLRVFCNSRPLMVEYNITIEELTLVILFWESPNIGTSLGTILIPVNLRWWGDRMVSEEGTVEAMAADTSHKKQIFSVFFSFTSYLQILLLCTWTANYNFSVFVVQHFILIIQLPVTSSPYLYSLYEHINYHKLK